MTVKELKLELLSVYTQAVHNVTGGNELLLQQPLIRAFNDRVKLAIEALPDTRLVLELPQEYQASFLGQLGLCEDVGHG